MHFDLSKMCCLYLLAKTVWGFCFFYVHIVQVLCFGGGCLSTVLCEGFQVPLILFIFCLEKWEMGAVINLQLICFIKT